MTVFEAVLVCVVILTVMAWVYSKALLTFGKCEYE